MDGDAAHRKEGCKQPAKDLDNRIHHRTLTTHDTIKQQYPPPRGTLNLRRQEP